MVSPMRSRRCSPDRWVCAMPFTLEASGARLRLRAWPLRRKRSGEAAGRRARGARSMPDVDSIYLAENMDVLPRFPDAGFQLVYIDPPFNTGKPQARGRSRQRATRPATARLRRAALPHGAARAVLLPRRLRRLPRVPRAAPARGAAAAERRRDALLPHRLPRGALLQAAARRDLRARVLPERDHLGVRLRRPRAAPLAGEARHDPRLREGS